MSAPFFYYNKRYQIFVSLQKFEENEKAFIPFLTIFRVISIGRLDLSVLWWIRSAGHRVGRQKFTRHCLAAVSRCGGTLDELMEAE